MPVSQYIVTTPEGAKYGPTDFQTLSRWADEGRVGPGMLVEDLLSGQTMTAASVPGLFSSYPREAESVHRQIGKNQPTTAMILGFLGIVAWCIPIVGLPVGAFAILFGVRALQTEEKIKGYVGIALGVMCCLLSIANAVLGAIWVSSMKG